MITAMLCGGARGKAVEYVFNFILVVDTEGVN